MAGPEQRTHYQVLGVRPSASQDEIRRTHRQLAYLLHPDRQAGATEAERGLAERRMREVNAAWTTLSDPVRRREYDRKLAAARTGPTSPPTQPSRPAPSSNVRAGAHGGRSGRPEDSDDPDAALARARMDELDPDEPELSVAHFWLLRRAPIAVILAVGALLFIVTAYAGGGGGSSSGNSAPPPLDSSSSCIHFNGEPNAYNVSCQQENDGTIVRHVDNALECDSDGERYALVKNQFVCVRTIP
jgi:curved DNA-binding protein CbpA